MSFWSSQKLEAELPDLIDDFERDRVDCNAYTLRVGGDLYVSPTDQAPDPSSTTARRLAVGEAFAIPPGQFAFLITEEAIRVPRDAMAFISVKAKIKFKGLVNVSGFHVDPGFQGRLVFSVYNAGPSVIHLRRGQDCFLIWYASLTESSEKYYKKGFQNEVLPTELINALPGELQSLEGLNRRIKDVESKLNERINRLEPKHAELITRLSIYIALLGALVLFLIRTVLSDQPVAPTKLRAPTAVVTPASTPIQSHQAVPSKRSSRITHSKP